jgi:ferredoxin--NADP+ reductase
MMKFCSQTTRPHSVPTVVSLNTIMVDGTGMCGGCRVSVGGETKFVCVDGPEFDGHKVDFDNMMRRLGAYADKERAAHERCHLELGLAGKEESAS